MKHIPNILSFFRIVLIPFFVWQIMIGETLIAGVILVVSGITDLLDGQLARRFNWITNLGKVLDPIADKLTQAAVSVTLMIRLKEYWYFFAIIIIKDLIMLLLGGHLLRKGVEIEGARWFGKISTCVYYGTMILIVFFPTMPGWIIVAFLSLATICALVAAVLYIPDFLDYRREVKAEKSL